MLHGALSALSGFTLLSGVAKRVTFRGRGHLLHRHFRRGAVRRFVRRFVAGVVGAVIGFAMPQLGLGVLVPVPVRARRRR